MRSSTSGDQRAWVFGLLTHPTHGIWDRCAFARCRGVLKYLRGGSTRVEDQDDARARAASRFGGNRQLVLHIASKHRRKKTTNILWRRVRGIEVRKSEDMEGVRGEHRFNVPPAVGQPVDFFLQSTVPEGKHVHSTEGKKLARR